MRCPDCGEEFDRKTIVDNENKCPKCGYDFKEGDEQSTDDFDDLMMTDFVADGELDGDF
jgi:PHP family Zn ribbon phosphoesterase